jgi:hypothetical protein
MDEGVTSSPVKPRALCYAHSPSSGTPQKYKTNEQMDLLSPALSTPFSIASSLESRPSPSPAKGFGLVLRGSTPGRVVRPRSTPTKSPAQAIPEFDDEDCSASLEPIGVEMSDSDSILPSLAFGDGCGIRRVSAETVAALMRGEFAMKCSRYAIVDCRYNYEHGGGHIHGAKNVMVQGITALYAHYAALETRKSKEVMDSSSMVMIFHCEYSKNRGPSSCKKFRQLDRDANVYPKLNFPELYVLDGGYRAFHKKFPQLCTPMGGFVSMWDSRFAAERKQCHKESKMGPSKSQLRFSGGRGSGARASAAMSELTQYPRPKSCAFDDVLPRQRTPSKTVPVPSAPHSQSDSLDALLGGPRALW